MDMITLAELESALGGTPDPGKETADWQRYISVISMYIDTQCADDFVRTENDQRRLVSNKSGYIALPGTPIWGVNNIFNLSLNLPDTYAFWDKDKTIRWCLPQSPYLIQFSHGHTTIPDDVKMVVKLLCSSIINGALTASSFQVGEVQETGADPIQSIMDDMIIGILSKYGYKQGYTLETSEGWEWWQYPGQTFITDPDIIEGWG